MKPILLTIFLMLCFSGYAFSQSDTSSADVPDIYRHNSSNRPNSRRKPMWIVKYKGQQYLMDTLTAKSLRSEWIDSLAFYSNSAKTRSFGRNSRSIIIVKINDTLHPEAFDTLKHGLIPFKRPGGN